MLWDYCVVCKRLTEWIRHPRLGDWICGTCKTH